MWMWGPGLNWDATSIGERCKFMDLDGDGSWMKARQESCDLNFVEQDQDGSLTHILKPGWVWHGAGVDLRCNLGGLEWRWNITLLLFRGKYMDLDWGKTRFGWDWDRTRMELMCNSRDLDGGDMRPGMRWDTKFSTWYELGRDMDGGEIRIQWPGYRWYSTYAHLETWIVDRVIWD